MISTQSGPPRKELQPANTLPIKLPEITAVALDRSELPRYKSLELTINVQAEYDNPYDAR